MTTEIQAVRPVGRPRSAHASEAIVSAVLELLAEGTTIEALSMEAIAARAGVGKATVYRRWANKEALVVDAIAYLKGPAPRLSGGSVRDDLVTMLRAVALSDSVPEGRILLAILPEIRRNPDLTARYAEMVDRRRDVFRTLLRRGMESGELRADLDVELAIALLSGPVVSVTAMHMFPRVSREHLVERVVDLVLGGIANREGGGTRPGEAVPQAADTGQPEAGSAPHGRGSVDDRG